MNLRCGKERGGNHHRCIPVTVIVILSAAALPALCMETTGRGSVKANFTAEQALIVLGGIVIAWLLILLARKKKSQEEGEAMDRFRSLFLLAPIPMAFISQSGQILYLNRRFTAVVGFEVGDIPSVDEWFAQAFPDPQYRLRAIELWKEATGGGDSANPKDIQIICRDGSKRFMEITAAGLGEVILVCLIDITDRKLAEENLKIFMESVDNSSDAIGMATPEGKHYYQNKAFDELFGSIGDNPRETVYVNKKVGEEVFSTIMAGGQWSGEIQSYAADGRILDIFLRAYAGKNENGDVTVLVGVNTDITERKQAENELRESQRFLSEVIENNGALIYVKDGNGRYKMANKKWEEVTFLKREDILGKTDEELFPGKVGSEFRKVDMQVMESKKVMQVEELLEDAAGKRYFLSIKFPLLDNDKNVQGLCGMSTEITERKRMENALRESEKRAGLQRTAIAYLAVKQYTDSADQISGIEHISKVMAETIGVARASVWKLSDDKSELHCLSLYEAETNKFNSGEILDPNTFPSYFEAIMAENRVYAEDAQNDPRTRELTDFYLRPLGITSLLDAGIFVEGRLVGLVSCEHIGNRRKWHADEESFISTMASITAQLFINQERKRDEEERENLKGQLVQAQKLESIGRLAGGIAHDFNNMLGVILGRTELALGKVDSSHPLHKSLKEIRKAAERSADLTRQLLAFARKQTIAPRPLDFNSTVEGMLTIVRRLIGENIELIWRPGGDLWSVKMDPSQIDQVLANLCVNSRDAIKGAGNITIATENRIITGNYCAGKADCVPGEYVMLSVGDNGCGMKKEILTDIFEPFFTTKEMGEGTGLGLSTVYGIVRQNDGFIDVNSEPGRGTTISIYLPRHTAAHESLQGQKQADLSARGHETILLVEDETTILEVAAIMLEELGYSVLTAGTPGDAISIAEENRGKIHLLITDVVMPGMNGRELSDKLLSIYPDLRCLFMSGYTASIIARHGVLDDGMHFIQKPFSMKDLAAGVREVLEG